MKELASAGNFYAPLLLRAVLGSLFIAHLYWKFAVFPGGIVRKGFWFVGGGAELPAVWAFMLVLQAMLGDGPYAARVVRLASA